MYWKALFGVVVAYVGVEVSYRYFDGVSIWASIVARVILLVGLLRFQRSRRYIWPHTMAVAYTSVVAGAVGAEFLIFYLLDWGSFQPSFAVPLAVYVDAGVEGAAIAMIVQYITQGARRRSS